MHRIDTAHREIDKFGVGKDGFTEGEPGVVAPTETSDDWFDACQEEICNVIESAGISLSKGTRDQLLSALRDMHGDGAGPGLKGTGGSSGGYGVEGIGGASGGIGLKGTSATGYGVEAEGDTTSPARAALHVVPQDTEASSPAKGNIQVITTNGKIVNHNGSAFERQVPQNHAIITDETESNYTTAREFGSSAYTISPGTLRAGSTIRVSFGANITTDGTAHKLSVRLYDGTTTLTITSISSGGGSLGGAYGIASFTFRSTGATAAVIGTGLITTPGAAVAGAQVPDRVSGTLDTSQPIDVSVYGEASVASTTTLEQFIVDVT